MDLASACTLPDPGDEIRAQFIQGCHSTKLREHILQIPGMSMADMLTMGRSKELSRVRAAHMESALQKAVKTEPINAITAGAAAKKRDKSKSSSTNRTCYFGGCTRVNCGGGGVRKVPSVDVDEPSVQVWSRSESPVPSGATLIVEEGGNEEHLPNSVPSGGATSANVSRKGLEKYDLRPCPRATLKLRDYVLK
ncbi:hypothetical protein NDU88_001934 [Pleurodeles waltl]|uniref:Uncharacterized protein n=1 Tax=Pleurodeles waltl TaxID=8319 RepID=A0AAV7M0Q2_PLEWA|nr:hypothetical protein NDU88_001934 [Pleurodeles waltl]